MGELIDLCVVVVEVVFVGDEFVLGLEDVCEVVVDGSLLCVVDVEWVGGICGNEFEVDCDFVVEGVVVVDFVGFDDFLG